MNLLLSIITQRRYLVTAVVALLLYILVYLAATQFLIFSSRMGEVGSFFTLKILPNWQDLIFRQRSPFLFESIGTLYVGSIKLFISVLNIAIAALLGTLIGANIAVSYYSFRSKLGLRGWRAPVARSYRDAKRGAVAP